MNMHRRILLFVGVCTSLPAVVAGTWISGEIHLRDLSQAGDLYLRLPLLSLDLGDRRETVELVHTTQAGNSNDVITRWDVPQFNPRLVSNGEAELAHVDFSGDRSMFHKTSISTTRAAKAIRGEGRIRQQGLELYAIDNPTGDTSTFEAGALREWRSAQGAVYRVATRGTHLTSFIRGDGTLLFTANYGPYGELTRVATADSERTLDYDPVTHLLTRVRDETGRVIFEFQYEDRLLSRFGSGDNHLAVRWRPHPYWRPGVTNSYFPGRQVFEVGTTRYEYRVHGAVKTLACRAAGRPREAISIFWTTGAIIQNTAEHAQP